MPIVRDGDERPLEAAEKILEPVNGVEIEVVGGLVEQESLRFAEQRLGKQDADFLTTLQLRHFAFVQFVGNIESLQQNRSIGFGGVAVFFADDALEFRQAHAVVVGEFGFFVDFVALRESGPKAFVAHHDGVDDAEGVEGVLVLLEDGEFPRADDGALLRVEIARKDLHERGLASAVGAGEAVAAAVTECGADFFEQNFGAVAHGDIANGNHAALNASGILLRI